MRMPYDIKAGLSIRWHLKVVKARPVLPELHTRSEKSGPNMRVAQQYLMPNGAGSGRSWLGTVMNGLIGGDSQGQRYLRPRLDVGVYIVISELGS